MHDLTAPGGVMMHSLPSHGRFDHGLVNYNPKFFWALAKANEYRWLYFDLIVDGAPLAMPANLIESIKPFRPEIVELAAAYELRPATFWVALQKRDAAEYATPADA
jgi:hypothetical protein